MTTYNVKSWTKNDISTVLDLWETTSNRDLANKLGVKPQQLQYMRMQISKAGYDLPRKRVVGVSQGLIKDVLREKGYMK